MTIALIIVLAVVAVAFVALFFRVLDARREKPVPADIGAPHAFPVPMLVPALLVLAAAAGLVAACVGIAGSVADSSQRRSDDVAACRSLYRSDIDTSNDQAADAESRRIDAFSDVILRSIDNDLDGVQTAGQRLATAKVDVATARVQVRRASAAYAAAVKLSASNQRAFLRECDRHL